MPVLKNLSHSLLLIPTLLGLGNFSVLAAPPRDFDYPTVTPVDPRRFPPNPLGILTPDPLLKDPKQNLSPLERDQLRSSLDLLHQEGQKKLSAKKTDEAFLIWFRELRLRQTLGLRDEIFALAKIGETAWQNNRTRDLRDITERLQIIQTQLQPTLKSDETHTGPEGEDITTIELKEYLALAYQLVRSPQLALTIHEPRLATLKSANLSNSLANPIEQFKTLTAIGQIHLEWFRYGKAKQTYQDLLELVRLAKNPLQEALYLIQLAYIAEQSRQPQDAIGPLQDLIKLYGQQPEVQPALHLRLAQNYFAAQNFAEAERTYQTTFTLSQPLSQNSYGSTALFELAALYQKTERWAAAEQTYDYLVDSEQAVYNLYDAMRAAEFLGQMRDRQKNYKGAIVAYEQAKALAKQLALKSDQIQLLQNRIDQSTKLDKSQS